MPGPHVLVILPQEGRGYGASHALDCHWALGVAASGRSVFATVPVEDVPAHVARCTRCGGGR